MWEKGPVWEGDCIMTEDGCIGFGEAEYIFGDMDYMTRFRKNVEDNTLIISEKSYGRLRRNGMCNCNLIVVSQTMTPESCPFAHVVRCPEEITNDIIVGKKVIVGGGRSVYEQFMPRMQTFKITVVHTMKRHADSFFPGFFPKPHTAFGAFGRSFKLRSRQSVKREDDFDYDILTFKRKFLS